MKKTAPTPADLIGVHPSTGNFADWLTSEDRQPEANLKHRKLRENVGKREEAVKAIAGWIITHHLDEKKIERLKVKKKKEILEKYNYKKYLQSLKPLPTADKTKKGNTTETILAEYLKASSGLKLLVYRLRYNPNIDQSMKGDDVLLLNPSNLYEKVILGEAKFRGIPDKAAVDELLYKFGKNMTLPLSLNFVAQHLSDIGQEDLAEKIEDLNAELYKNKVPIINVGFMLSNANTADTVEKHASPTNPYLVLLSLSIEDPAGLVLRSCDLAYQKLEENP